MCGARSRGDWSIGDAGEDLLCTCRSDLICCFFGLFWTALSFYFAFRGGGVRGTTRNESLSKQRMTRGNRAARAQFIQHTHSRFSFLERLLLLLLLLATWRTPPI